MAFIIMPINLSHQRGSLLLILFFLFLIYSL